MSSQPAGAEKRYSTFSDRQLVTPRLVHTPRYVPALITLLMMGLACFLTFTLGLLLAHQAVRNQHLPHGLQTALHAGWAVRTGNNLYDVQNGDHFHGPPLAAIGLVPLAQPPGGERRSDAIPPALALLIWYLLSVGLVLGSVHWLATALDGQRTPGSWPWWRLRVLPLVLLAGPIYLLLAYGHADAILLALLTGMLCALLKHRIGTAGLLLGASITFHIVPLYLLLVNIIRRDRFMTMGTVAGLGLCLMLVPGTVFGLQRTSFLNEQYLAEARQLLQQDLDPAMLAALALLTGICCWAHGWHRAPSPRQLLHLFCGLLCIMVLGWNAGDSHRYVLLLPAMVGLVSEWITQQQSRTWLSLGMVSVAFCLALPVWFNQAGIWPQVGTLLMWGMHTTLLARARAQQRVEQGDDSSASLVSLPRAA